MSDPIDTTLAARGADYGDYAAGSQIADELMQIMEEAPNWRHLSAAQRQSLRMIACKASRLLNGNPDHVDSWRDIAGYASLAERDCARRTPASERPSRPSPLSAEYVRSQAVRAQPPGDE